MRPKTNLLHRRQYVICCIVYCWGGSPIQVFFRFMFVVRFIGGSSVINLYICYIKFKKSLRGLNFQHWAQLYQHSCYILINLYLYNIELRSGDWNWSWKQKIKLENLYRPGSEVRTLPVISRRAVRVTHRFDLKKNVPRSEPNPVNEIIFSTSTLYQVTFYKIKLNRLLSVRRAFLRL